MLPIPARVIATCFALACFAGCLVVGIYRGNDATTIVFSSVLAMIAAYFVGLIVGAVAQHAVDDHIRKHKAQHPIPGEEDNADTSINDDLAPATAPRG